MDATPHFINTPSIKSSPIVLAIHKSVRGRARFKVRGLRRSSRLKHLIEWELSQEVGIVRTCASTLTGNVLVTFNPRHLNVDTISSRLREIASTHRNKKSHGLSPKPKPHLEPTRPRAARGNLGRSVERLYEPSEQNYAADLQRWHTTDAESVLNHLETSVTAGLSSDAARASLKRYGPNRLSVVTPRSRLGIFIDYFKSVPVALLTSAALLSVATGGVVDAAVIMGVVVINAVLGYATESHSDRVIRSLQSLAQPSALVVRDGNLQEMPAAEVTVGDILVFRPGSYVPADARLIDTERLTIDESALTGESLSVCKTDRSLSEWNVPLADRRNMAYMGTLVTSGQGTGVVVATGTATEMGRIQALVGDAVMPQTPMEKQLDRAGSQLVAILGVVCGGIFGVGLLRGYGWLRMLKTSISLAVAAVPEGLPTVATSTLALGIARMRKHHVAIRRLDAVEALGSVQTICLDKTGTLTENRMSVAELCADAQRKCLDGGRFSAEDTSVVQNSGLPLHKLIHVAVLCNESDICRGNDGEFVLSGSPTENALVELAIAAGVDVLELKQEFPTAKIIPRAENRNYMTTIHCQKDGRELVAVKGSPSEVLELCSHQYRNTEILPLTELDRQAIETDNEIMAGKGLRVLGGAYRVSELNGTNESHDSELIWLGLIGMTDPVRSGVKELMEDFHRAGIDTVMLTGDQSPTAYAIGKQLHLCQDSRLEILDSTHLAEIDPEILKGLCERVHIFARISPAHKLQIVQSLQAAGKVVAMTGDGINDAPALKAANIGIAMGNGGTDVAREVADVVLEDDSLDTTIAAVSQGRTIYNNIRKSVHFLLSTNLSEILVVLLANTAGMGQPLNAMQLLWLNLVTDIFPGLALALEPPEPDVLHSPPRDPEESIIKPSDTRRIAFESSTLTASVLGAYGYGLSRYGSGPQASTIAFMSLVMGQLLHSLSCRSSKRALLSDRPLPPNPHLNLALTGSVALQLLSALVPGLRAAIGVARLGLLDTAAIAVSALLPLLVNEFTKADSQQLGPPTPYKALLTSGGTVDEN